MSNNYVNQKTTGICLAPTGPPLAPNNLPSLSRPNLSRPAFIMPSVCKLVTAGKCTSCKADVCLRDFKQEIARKEYSISGICAKCQATIFQQPEQTRRSCSEPQPLSELEAEAWAAELGASHKPSDTCTRYTLENQLNYSALLRGIHNIQVRGGSAADEKRFCNAVCDKFGAARFDFSD
jgi:hypothetical protein